MDHIRTIWDLLTDAAADERRGLREYIDAENGRHYNRRTLLTDSKAAASWFREQVRGENIAFICNASYEFMVAYYGCIGAGKIAVMLNPLIPEEQTAELIAFTEADCVVTDIGLVRLQKIQATLQRDFKMVSLKDTKEQTGFLAQIKRQYQNDSFTPELQPESVSTIVFTSGTTGQKKGVMLSHSNLVSNVLNVHQETDYSMADRGVSMLPPSHVYGLCMEILMITYLGMELVFEKNIAAAFKHFPKTCPSVLLMVPMMADMLALKLRAIEKKQPELPLAQIKEAVCGNSLRAIGCGGAKVRKQSIIHLDKYGISCRPGYGMTELSPIIAINNEGLKYPEAAGKIIHGDKVRIKAGEIQIQGPNVAVGYYKNKEEFHRMWDGDWFCTGDLGYMNENDMVVLTGRRKNLIITSSGENISPEYLEGRFLSYEEIKEVMVYARNDILVAEVLLQENITEKRMGDIMAEINKVLPIYSRIQQIIRRSEEFRKNVNGKIMRYEGENKYEYSGEY